MLAAVVYALAASGGYMWYGRIFVQVVAVAAPLFLVPLIEMPWWLGMMRRGGEV